MLVADDCDVYKALFNQPLSCIGRGVCLFVQFSKCDSWGEIDYVDCLAAFIYVFLSWAFAFILITNLGPRHSCLFRVNLNPSKPKKCTIASYNCFLLRKITPWSSLEKML